MSKNIFDVTGDLLKTNDKYVAEDGKLLKAVVYSDVKLLRELFLLKYLGLLYSTNKNLLGLWIQKNFYQIHILALQIKLV